MPATLSMNRWHNAVHYRWDCEGGCGAKNAWVAVIRRRGHRDVRLCETCYADGFWRHRSEGRG